MKLIIGYGSLLRGDDAIGQVLAQQLEDAGVEDSFTVVACTQLTPELVELIRQASFVLFIDACAGKHAGRFFWEMLEPGDIGGLFAHHVTPESLLAGSLGLYDRCPPAALMRIEGENFELSDSLSPRMQAVLPLLLAAVRRFVVGMPIQTLESMTC